MRKDQIVDGLRKGDVYEVRHYNELDNQPLTDLFFYDTSMSQPYFGQLTIEGHGLGSVQSVGNVLEWLRSPDDGAESILGYAEHGLGATLSRLNSKRGADVPGEKRILELRAAGELKTIRQSISVT